MLASTGPLATSVKLTEAAAWDARIDAALARAAAPLRRSIAWLRDPSHRWVCFPAALLLILGGLLSLLPVLGLWMLPLGLALLAEDMPRLKGGLERVARRVERLIARLRR